MVRSDEAIYVQDGICIINEHVSVPFIVLTFIFISNILVINGFNVVYHCVLCSHLEPEPEQADLITKVLRTVLCPVRWKKHSNCSHEQSAPE